MNKVITLLFLNHKKQINLLLQSKKGNTLLFHNKVFAFQEPFQFVFLNNFQNLNLLDKTPFPKPVSKGLEYCEGLFYQTARFDFGFETYGACMKGQVTRSMETAVILLKPKGDCQNFLGIINAYARQNILRMSISTL